MRILGLIACLIGGVAMAAEYPEPASEIVVRDGNFTVRDYSEIILATVTVESSERMAMRKAFDPLAAYITGANESASGISMTTPVLREPVEIGMTVPVTRSKTDEGSYDVSFVMPDDFTWETLPRPTDPRVRLERVPARRIAAVELNGPYASDQEAATAALEQWIADQGLTVIKGPIYAVFDSGYGSAASGRKNEVQFVVENGPSVAGD